MKQETNSLAQEFQSSVYTCSFSHNSECPLSQLLKMRKMLTAKPEDYNYFQGKEVCFQGKEVIKGLFNQPLYV